MNLLLLRRAWGAHATVFPLQRLWGERRRRILVAGIDVGMGGSGLLKGHVVVKRVSQEGSVDDILSAIVLRPKSSCIDIG